MKWIISFLMLVAIINLVSAITLNEPTENEYIPVISLNATSQLTNSNVSFYLSPNQTINDEYLVGFYNGTNLGQINYTGITGINNTSLDNRGLWYKFFRDARLIDSTGTYNLTAISGATHVQNYGIVDSYYFDGNDYIYRTGALAITQAGNQSWSFWIYPNSTQTGNGGGGNNIGQIFQNSPATDNRHGAVVYTANALGECRIAYSVINGTYSSVSGNIECDKWSHVVLTNQNRVVKMYINGIEQFGKLQAYSHTTTQILLGRNSISPYNYFIGFIDEFMYFSDIVSQQEAENMYESGEGKYYWKVKDINATTSQESSTQSFSLDLFNPKIILTEPKYESDNGHINLSSYDTNLFNNISINITLDNNQIYSTTFNQTINYINDTNLQSGNHNLTIISIDYSGRITTKEKIFDVIKINKINIFSDSNTAVLNFFSNTKHAILNFFK